MPLEKRKVYFKKTVCVVAKICVLKGLPASSIIYIKLYLNYNHRLSYMICSYVQSLKERGGVLKGNHNLIRWRQLKGYITSLGLYQERGERVPTQVYWTTWVIAPTTTALASWWKAPSLSQTVGWHFHLLASSSLDSDLPKGVEVPSLCVMV